MKRYDLSLEKFKGGWLVGDFDPNLLRRKDIEVAVKYLNLGFIDESHYHEKSTEYNFVLNGSIKTETGEIARKGECFVYEPSEISRTEALEDNTIILALRDSSNPDDKCFL